MKKLTGIVVGIVLGFATNVHAAPGDSYDVVWTGPLRSAEPVEMTDVFAFADDAVPIFPGISLGTFASELGPTGSYLYIEFLDYTVFSGEFQSEGLSIATSGVAAGDEVSALGAFFNEADPEISGFYLISGSLSSSVPTSE